MHVFVSFSYPDSSWLFSYHYSLPVADLDLLRILLYLWLAVFVVEKSDKETSLLEIIILLLLVFYLVIQLFVVDFLWPLSAEFCMV